jgi:hypothetical protein
MAFIWFMVLGTLETSAVYFLIFRLFKFDLYITSIIFASLLSTFISYTIREEFGLASVDMVLQVVLMIAFCWQLFRVQVFYSIIMVNIGYTAYVTFQTLLYMLINQFGFIPDVPDPLKLQTYALQALSASIVFGVGWYIKKTNVGFSFVPHSYQKVVLSGTNHILKPLIYSTAALVPLIASFIFLLSHFNGLFFIIPTAFSIILFSLISWSYKKELSDD